MKSEDFDEAFNWRGLVFERAEKEDQILIRYKHGYWRVWAEIRSWNQYPPVIWYAGWQITYVNPLLFASGNAETREKALDICFDDLENKSREHGLKMGEMAQRLNKMIIEQTAARENFHQLASLLKRG